MAKKKKVSRKELLREDDAFIQAASSSAEWLKENRAAVMAAGIATVVAILGIWIGLLYVEDRDLEASQNLAAALAVFDGEVVEEGADPSATPPTFASEKAKWAAAKTAFEELATSSGKLSPIGVFYLADIAEKSGDLVAAQEGFAEAIEVLAPGDTLYFLAVERLAYLQERSGKSADALATLEKIKSKDGFYSDYTSFHRARIHLANGEKDKARTILERVQSDFPESSLKDDIKERLAVLVEGTKAEAPSE